MLAALVTAAQHLHRVGGLPELIIPTLDRCGADATRLAGDRMLPSMNGQLLDTMPKFARRRWIGEQTADNLEPPRGPLRRALRFSRGNCFSISPDEAPFEGVSSFYSLAKWSRMGKLCGVFKSSKKRDSNRPNDFAATALPSSSEPAATRHPDSAVLRDREPFAGWKAVAQSRLQIRFPKNSKPQRSLCLTDSNCANLVVSSIS